MNHSSDALAFFLVPYDDVVIRDKDSSSQDSVVSPAAYSVVLPVTASRARGGALGRGAPPEVARANPKLVASLRLR
jgi:hypothetical protein